MDLKPSREIVGIDRRYRWDPQPPATAPSKQLGSVWYLALPLTSAHRGSHSGGGALIAGAGQQDRYLNEGTVYPHAALLEMITYQARYTPDIDWRYIDMSHVPWPELCDLIAEDPPDVVALTVYTSTALWAFIVAAEIKRVKPSATVIFGNDHAGILHAEILTGTYGRRLVDFVSTGNNGPFTMLGLLHVLRGQLDIGEVPSIAYRRGDDVINQAAASHPLNGRLLPDYRLIVDQLERYYDKAFAVWYSQHYDLKRMVTLPLDGGCTWGSRPSRRCKHCSIQGLTPKTMEVTDLLPALETVVGELGANVYAAGDSTLGFSRQQWGGGASYLDDLAEACARSPVLHRQRFMLAYGLVYEFLQSAHLCQGFVRTWNVGLEAFDPGLLRADSKGINRGLDHVLQALDLARDLDYKLYLSGIIGLPGTTLRVLKSEVENWLALAEGYQDSVTTVSVAAPAIIPGSRMYWEALEGDPVVRAGHGEIIPTRRLTARYIEQNTEVTLRDIESAIAEIGRGVIAIGERRGGMKFGGYMFGGTDVEEEFEWRMLREICSQL